MRQTPFHVRCYARREGNQWIAICIDLGLAVQGESCDEVKSKLESQINDYVHDALTVDRAHAADLLNRPAPLRYRLEYHTLRLWQALFSIPKTQARAFRELVAVPA